MKTGNKLGREIEMRNKNIVLEEYIESEKEARDEKIARGERKERGREIERVEGKEVTAKEKERGERREKMKNTAERIQRHDAITHSLIITVIKFFHTRFLLNAIFG